VLGYESTVPVTVEEMLMLTRVVRRGLQSALLVADLPVGSYEGSDEQAVRTAHRFVKEGGADVVKLERAGTSVDRARAVIRAGIPVMGHVGLTPQAATALELQAAGCFAIVLEAVPAAVTELLAPMMTCLVIGIGAGGSTDGQVLVWHDLLGLTSGHVAKFVREFADLHTETTRGLTAYTAAVRQHEFPTTEHTYAIPPEELADLRQTDCRPCTSQLRLGLAPVSDAPSPAADVRAQRSLRAGCAGPGGAPPLPGHGQSGDTTLTLPGLAVIAGAVIQIRRP
jgi:3-methyl-2-oxobutanoate hydroxymethyltransferase